MCKNLIKITHFFSKHNSKLESVELKDQVNHENSKNQPKNSPDFMNMKYDYKTAKKASNRAKKQK